MSLSPLGRGDNKDIDTQEELRSLTQKELAKVSTAVDVFGMDKVSLLHALHVESYACERKNYIGQLLLNHGIFDQKNLDNVCVHVMCVCSMNNSIGNL